MFLVSYFVFGVAWRGRCDLALCFCRGFAGVSWRDRGEALAVRRCKSRDNFLFLQVFGEYFFKILFGIFLSGLRFCVFIARICKILSKFAHYIIAKDFFYYEYFFAKTPPFFC